MSSPTQRGGRARAEPAAPSTPDGRPGLRGIRRDATSSEICDRSLCSSRPSQRCDGAIVSGACGSSPRILRSQVHRRALKAAQTRRALDRHNGREPLVLRDGYSLDLWLLIRPGGASALNAALNTIRQYPGLSVPPSSALPNTRVTKSWLRWPTRCAGSCSQFETSGESQRHECSARDTLRNGRSI